MQSFTDKISGIHSGDLNITKPTKISGIVNGNIVASAPVKISGIVNGSVLLKNAGSDNKISGTVSGNLTVDGCKAKVSGIINGKTSEINGGNIEKSGGTNMAFGNGNAIGSGNVVVSGGRSIQYSGISGRCVVGALGHNFTLKNDQLYIDDTLVEVKINKKIRGVSSSTNGSNADIKLDGYHILVKDGKITVNGAAISL